MKNIRIRFCRVWNYRPRAARVAALIKKKTGFDSELIEGDRGEFTVWVEERLVARKDSLGFPSDKEVLTAVQQALGPEPGR